MDPSVVLKRPKNLALTTEKNARASVYSLSQKKFITECRWSPKILTKMRVVGPNFPMGTFWKTLGKKSALVGQKSVSLAKNALLHGTYCILYGIEFANLQLRSKATHLPRK